MKPQQQRELAIWGGATLAVVIGGAILLSWQAGDAQQRENRAEDLYRSYHEYYVDSREAGVSRDDAVSRVASALTHQRDELDLVESRLVWPGRGGDGVPVEFTGMDFRRDIDYPTAHDKVSRVHARLRSRAESLDIDLPQSLPLGERDAIDNANAVKRSQQMAQACAFAAITELAIETGVRRITQISLGPSWRDSNGDYAVVTVSLACDCSYETADAIMRDLRRNRFGLGMHESALEVDRDSYRFMLTASLIVPYRSDWKLGPRKAPERQRAVEARRSTSSDNPAVRSRPLNRSRPRSSTQ